MDGFPSKTLCQRKSHTPKHLSVIDSQLEDIVSSIIDNCKRKKTLGYVINEVMSRFQYANAAGFNLINLFGEFRPIYQGNQDEIKEQWHLDMIQVLTKTLTQTVLPSSVSTQRVIVAMCEEYDMNCLLIRSVPKIRRNWRKFRKS